MGSKPAGVRSLPVPRPPAPARPSAVRGATYTDGAVPAAPAAAVRRSERGAATTPGHSAVLGGAQGHSRSLWSTKGHSGTLRAPRGTLWCSGALRGAQGHSGGLRRHSGTLRGAQGHSEVLRGTPECSGSLRGTQGRCGTLSSGPSARNAAGVCVQGGRSPLPQHQQTSRERGAVDDLSVTAMYRRTADAAHLRGLTGAESPETDGDVTSLLVDDDRLWASPISALMGDCPPVCLCVS